MLVLTKRIFTAIGVWLLTLTLVFLFPSSLYFGIRCHFVRAHSGHSSDPHLNRISMMRTAEEFAAKRVGLCRLIAVRLLFITFMAF